MLNSLQLSAKQRKRQAAESIDTAMRPSETDAADYLELKEENEEEEEEKHSSAGQVQVPDLNLPQTISDPMREYSGRGREAKRTNCKRGRDPLALAPRDAANVASQSAELRRKQRITASTRAGQET